MLLSFTEIFACLQSTFRRKKSGKGCFTWLLHCPLVTCAGYLCSAQRAGGSLFFLSCSCRAQFKIISKNMRAICTITGHSRISQCFLRLVPNFVLRSSCIYGHWTSNPGSGRGEHYPGAWGSHIPETDVHRASHSGTCHSGFCHGSGSHHASRGWQVCRTCLPKLCRANRRGWVQTPPHAPSLPSRSDPAILNQYTAFGSQITAIGVLQQLMLFQAQWAGVNMQRMTSCHELLVPAEAGVTRKMSPSLFHRNLDF